MRSAPAINRLLAGLALAVSLALLPAASASAAASNGEVSRKLAPPLAALAEGPAPSQDQLLGLSGDGPGSLVRRGGQVLLTARFEAGVLAALPRLRAAGARIVSADGGTQTVTVAVDPALLPALAGVAGLKAAWPVR